ncbi:spore coat U domain-containing protein [Rhizobium herbae]|uniref:Spore coat U domain-containing protein n=1 Tax=Rhizobium herbae TaxID=508661 RepID=A0ABS7HD16_9HYPH|nr:spore coat U domain-containing protein [Rhizobium herbae]MBW9064457.1 spore coat U domain-containing protein [Rhizobium herbae]
MTTVTRISLLLAALFILKPGAARAALSCATSAGTLAFGSVTVTTGSSATATNTVTLSCSGVTSATTAYVCVGIAADPNGLATSATNRYLTSGSNRLQYGTYTDATYTMGWGSWSWASGGTAGKVFTVAVPANGTGTASVAIYARLSSTQTFAAGSYSGFMRIQTSVPSTTAITNCAGSTSAGTANALASATVAASCMISASDLNFGTVGLLASEVTGSTSLAVTCTNGTAYTIGLNNGLTGTGPTQRKMTNGTASVTYGLYRDASETLPFGNTSGTNTYSGSGSGVSQAVTVYGRVPAQTSPIPGTYSDTIVATVTY